MGTERRIQTSHAGLVQLRQRAIGKVAISDSIVSTQPTGRWRSGNHPSREAISKRMRVQVSVPGSIYHTASRDSRRDMVRSPPETTEPQCGTLPYGPASQQEDQYRRARDIKVQDTVLVHSMTHCGPSRHERHRVTLSRRRSTK